MHGLWQVREGELMAYRHWTTRELAYVRQHYPTQGAKKVGEALGRPHGSVAEYARRHGIKRINQVGGAYTLDLIRARCIVHGPDDDHADCWDWTGHCHGKGQVPYVWHNGKLGSARRVVYSLAHPDKALSQKYVIRPRCENPTCLNPEHLYLQTRVALKNENAAKEPVALRMARSAAQGRERFAVLDLDKVREIRASGATAAALSERFGVTATTIRRIRRGEMWRDLAGNDQLRRAA